MKHFPMLASAFLVGVLVMAGLGFLLWRRAGQPPAR